MNAIRIRRRLDSPIPQFPELSGLVGKEVEITVVETENGATLAGREAHFHPVGAWEGPPGEFDRLMNELATSRDAAIEFDRESRP